MKSNIVNFVLFQVGWLACVASANTPFVLLGIVTAALIILAHLTYHPNEWLFIVLLTLGGFVIEWLHLATGVLTFPNTGPLWPPLWIVCLWPLFGTTFRHSLGWLNNRYLLAAALAAVAGPAAYYAGFKLNALSMADPLYSLTVLAVVWGTVFPLILKTAWSPITAGAGDTGRRKVADK